MLRRAIFSAILTIGLPSLALAQAGAPLIQGIGTAGTPVGGVVSVQGVSGGTAVPVSIQSGGGTDNVNIAQVNGATVNVGTGAASTGTQRVTTSTDSTIGTVTTVTSATVIQPTAANLNATVVGTGTFVDQSTITPSATVGWTTQSCTVACASTIVSGAHTLGDAVFSATVTGWLFIYDATSCSANGTVTPKKAYAYTTANVSIGLSWADIPIVNSTGIAACFSSTGPYTATASTTAFISVDFK